MRNSGYSWPVIDLKIRYMKPAAFGQIISVKRCSFEWENHLKIDCLGVDKHMGSKLAKGYSIQVAVDRVNREMCFESPAVLFEKLDVPFLYAVKTVISAGTGVVYFSTLQSRRKCVQYNLEWDPGKAQCNIKKIWNSI